MPGLNGLEVAQAAKKEDLETSLIILTGHGEKEDAVEAVNLHIDHWFEKQSVDLTDLLATVRQLAEGLPIEEIQKLMASVPKNDKS
jgi:YesN/AraC family two-component response regulator